jgi:outer membrane protein OmpA-like peptidoglycan-associated protein
MMSQKLQQFFLLGLVSIITSNSFAQNLEEWDLIELGDTINTRYHESAPLVTPDGTRVYFFVSDHPENNDRSDKTQDIWYSDRNEYGYWGKALHMDPPLNNHQFNQVFTILDDGKTLFLRGGSSKRSKGFSFSSYNGKSWSSPKEIEVDGFEEMNRGIFNGATISQDRQYLILYFNERTGKTISDLYLSKRAPDGTYTTPQKIAMLSTYKDEFNPYLSNDDQVLYFASDRPGTLGSADIWRTERLDDTWLNWSEPVNLGEPVNTRQFDAFFSMDATGKLGFTTRGFQSADGSNLDLYGLIPKPVITITGKVYDSLSGKPLQIDAVATLPINGSKDFSSSGEGKFEFSTNQFGDILVYGLKDGYYDLDDTISVSHFKKDTTIVRNLAMLPKQLSTILSGYVSDSLDSTPLSVEVMIKGDSYETTVESGFEEGYYEKELIGEGRFIISVSQEGYNPYRATFELALKDDNYFADYRHDIRLKRTIRPYVVSGYTYDEQTNDAIEAEVKLFRNDSLISSTSSDVSGFYRIEVTDPGQYLTVASKEGYLNLNNELEIQDNQNFLDYALDHYLQPIEIGATVIIKNIYFDFDKTTLKPESFPELDRMVELMNQNPNLTIEISGHTDDKGSDEYNKNLSAGRAEAVMDYLTNAGISDKRMNAVGYGEEDPIATNTTDEGRAQNRRVQFTILTK